MINLTFFLAPIVVIVVVIVIESWLMRHKQKSAGTPPNKKYIAVRICSGIGGFASIWLLFFLFFWALYPLSLYYSEQLKALFTSPIERTEWAVFGGIATMGGLLLAFFDRRIERGHSPFWFKYPKISVLGVFGGLLALPLACGVAAFGLPRLEATIYRHLPGVYSRPLESAVAAHLCAVLQLEAGDKRCQGEAVYTLDFFPEMKRHAPRELMEEKLGVYRVGCDQWVATLSDGISRRCYYRFPNDRVYVLIIYRGSYPDSFDFDDPTLPQEISDGDIWGAYLDLAP
jgi:hypothetical protein